MTPAPREDLDTRVARALAKLDSHRRALDASVGDADEHRHEVTSLLATLREWDDDEVLEDLVRNGAVDERRPTLARHLLSATWAEEESAWLREMGRARAAAAAAGRPLDEHPWGAYGGMRRTLELLDLDGCNRLVLVGCGPLPDSLFCCLDHTEVPHLVGIDQDASACARARALLDEMATDRIEIVHAEGVTFDYGTTDIACISAFVTDRAAVLERVIASGSPGTQVVLRLPIRAGVLLFEPTAPSLPDGLIERAGTDQPSGPFGLRYAVLEVDGIRR